MAGSCSNAVNGSFMLLFKKKFLEPIRAGTKSQTIRLWKYRKLRVGQRSYIPGAGYIRIAAVDEVTLDALTDADAALDGFSSAVELRGEIESLYRESLARGERAFRIRFELLSPAEQEAARAERLARKKIAASTPPA